MVPGFIEYQDKRPKVILIMKTRISALITTYNESRFLDECLCRLSFCDEIIVVDLGSTDNCVEIAQKHGAKILFHELVPFAEKVRDLAIGNATNDWVLFTDPDMYFPWGIGNKIDEFISGCPDEIGIIHIPARKYFRNQLIKHGSKSAIESRVALLNRKKVDFLPLVHYSGIMPRENILSVGLAVKADEYIEHYWANSMREAIEKALRYLPYESERRHYIYNKFSIKAVVKEFIKTVSKEVELEAYKNKDTFQILLFNIWYVIDANIRWLIYEIRLNHEKRNQRS